MSTLFSKQRSTAPGARALRQAQESRASFAPIRRTNYGVLIITEAVKAAFSTIETPTIQMPHKGLKSQ